MRGVSRAGLLALAGTIAGLWAAAGGGASAVNVEATPSGVQPRGKDQLVVRTRTQTMRAALGPFCLGDPQRACTSYIFGPTPTRRRLVVASGMSVHAVTGDSARRVVGSLLLRNGDRGARYFTFRPTRRGARNWTARLPRVPAGVAVLWIDVRYPTGETASFAVSARRRGK